MEENVEQYSTVNVEVTETLDEQVLEPQQEDSPNNGLLLGLCEFIGVLLLFD